MKKIFTIIIGLSLGSSTFAQIDPATGNGVIHIYNHDDYHSLNLNFTLFTMDPNTCTPDFQALGPTIPLGPGQMTKYAKYTDSDTAAGHPFPIDEWYNGSYLLPSQIPQNIADNQRWTYMKFQLKEPVNPGQSIPGLGGSVGFYQPCTGIPDLLTGSGTTTGGTTYNFVAKAYTMGGDLWIDVY